MKEYIVQQRIEINTPKRIVWETLTNPDLTEKYFFGCRVYSNFMVDDPIIFKRMILWLFPFELKGKILEINRGTLLKYSLKNARSSSMSIVQIDLQEDTGKTLVSVSDDVGQGEGAEGRYSRSIKGWMKILSGLKRVSEQNNK